MVQFTRRAMMSGLAAAGTAPLAMAAQAEKLPRNAGLKDHAASAGLVYGAAIGAENWAVPECRSLYEREVGLVTTDLELKFGILRPSREEFNFSPADTLVGWAHEKAILIRGHTLIWNENNGDWLNRCSASEVERIFDEHIERVVSRYAGRIHTWDVVNEPFWPDHGEPGGYRRGPWYNALGPGYIARALKRARAIDKAAKLCVNEAHVDSDQDWGRAIRPCLARLVAQLRHDGVPIDAVGVQCHLQPQWPHDYVRFGNYLRDLAANKVELHVTEFDVNDQSFPDAVGKRDQLVAAYAAAFLNAVLPVREITMVVTWELADRWSSLWRAVADKDPQAKRLPRPLPFDSEYKRKPLWQALARGFDARAPS